MVLARPQPGKTEALLNHETAITNKTPKQLFFLPFFFSNTKTHKETNAAHIGPVENFVTSAKGVGLVFNCRCLYAQSGYKFKCCFGFSFCCFVV